MYIEGSCEAFIKILTHFLLQSVTRLLQKFLQDRAKDLVKQKILKF